MANAAPSQQTLTLEMSPEQELVVPASVLAGLGFKPGQKFVALAFQGSIRLIPLVSAEEARGSMPGLDTTIDREDDEERV
jgi:hypothetical protein